MNDCYVYILFKENGHPFYVGMGSGDRWLSHGTRKRHLDTKTRKGAIIKRMVDAGLDIPRVKVAEGLTRDEANDLERLLISVIGRHPNGPLVNLTEGGDGVVSPSQEVRDRISKSLTGRKQDPEVVARRGVSVSRALSGKKRKPHSEEHKKAISDGLKANYTATGHTHSGMAGKSHSPETKAKMRKAALGRTISPEQKAAISKAQSGRVPSKEELEKRSISLKAAWVKRKQKKTVAWVRL